jgi:hypothetical protein
LVQIADEKLASSNLSSFPYRALVEEPWRSKYLNPVVDIFRSLCEALAKAKKYDILFISALELHHHLPIPNRLSLLPECKEVLDQVRLGVIEVIPDRTLIKIFGAPNDYRGRASSIGHSRFRDESAASKALRELIGQRYKKIKMDGQKK